MVWVILRKIRNAIVRFLCFGFLEKDDPALEARRSLEKLKARLEELKLLAARVNAAGYNLERDLAAEREWLERIEESDGREAEIGASRVRVNELQAGLEASRVCYEQAREQVERFQDELRLALGRVRDAQFRNRLADLRIQAEKIAFDSAMQEDFAAIDRIEDCATKAQAEAAAAAEVNAVLGIGEDDSPDPSSEGRSGR